MEPGESESSARSLEEKKSQTVMLISWWIFLRVLLDRQDSGDVLTPAEREEAEGLVESSEFSSLLYVKLQTVSL